MIAKKVCAIGGATLDLIIAYEDMEMMTLENTDSARNYLLLEEGSRLKCPICIIIVEVALQMLL